MVTFELCHIDHIFIELMGWESADVRLQYHLPAHSGGVNVQVEFVRDQEDRIHLSWPPAANFRFGAHLRRLIETLIETAFSRSGAKFPWPAEKIDPFEELQAVELAQREMISLIYGTPFRVVEPI